jgi:hypothetical protein
VFARSGSAAKYEAGGLNSPAQYQQLKQSDQPVEKVFAGCDSQPWTQRLSATPNRAAAALAAGHRAGYTGRRERGETVTTTPVDSTEAVMTRHLQAFVAGDLEGILADYAAGAILFSPYGVVRRDGLADLFTGVFAEFSKPGTTFNVQYQVVEGEIGFIVWSAETADNKYEFATDTFVIRSGKITSQTFAAKISPKT